MKTNANTIRPVQRNAGLRQDVVTSIVEAIFQQQLKGGDRLVVQKLAESLQVSATPVREALLELAGIGLVEYVQNRGAICCPFGPQQLLEVFQIRRILEAEATRCACARIPKVALVSLQAQQQELVATDTESSAWCAEAIAVDDAFHDLVMTYCGSERLALEMNRYRPLMHEVRRFVGDRATLQMRSAQEHLQVLTALSSGDAIHAAEAMAAHIERSAQDNVRVMFSEHTL